MLSLRVVSQQGKAPASPMIARFDTEATIGRSPGCTLALPDPNRHISREQAKIQAGPAGFTIRCTGSASAILLNGEEIAPGESAALRPGDSLIVAEYEIVVESDAASGLPQAPLAGGGGTIDDPFAALGLSTHPEPSSGPLGDLGLPPGPQRGVDRAHNHDPLGIGVALNSRDEMGASVGRGLTASDSLDAMFDLAGVSPDPLGAVSRLAGPASQPNTALSSDPMMSFGMQAKAAPAALPDTTPEIAGTFRLPDEIPPTSFGFGLDLADAKAEAPFPAPSSAQPTAHSPVKPAVASSAPPEAFLSWQQPLREAGSLTGDLAPAAPAASAAPKVGSRFERPDAAVAVPTLAAQEIRAITDEIADRHRSDFEPPPRTRPTDFLNELNRAQVEALHAEIARSKAARPASPVGAAMPTTTAEPSEAPIHPPAAPYVESASRENGGPFVGAPESDRANSKLLEGLLLGLGLPELPRSPLAPRGAPPTLTPELMRRLGELVRVGTQGTIDQLQARATLKREMKTEVTMIASRDNNPLKFSPDAQAALAHLLSSHSIRGFLDPVPALQDAYDDLLAHQVGFVAGMRAAMHGLIARFDPAVLESRLTRKSMLDSMIPSGRKARLWELFAELYADISREAEDDFEALFGREFVKAYEQQIANLQNDQDR